MRGHDSKQATMFSMVSPEHRVPADHPLRPIKAMADQVLAGMSRTFNGMYSQVGRPSIPPERLLKSQILIALYSVRSDRMFCEQLAYNLLFRWFLDMNMDEAVFDHSSFTKNRDRLLEHDVAGQFFVAVVEEGRRLGLMSSEHFSVDGTLIEAWASLKSFRPRDEKPEDRDPPDDPGNPSVNFHGEKRRNDTHASTTDGEAKLARKGNGKEAKLCFSAHALMENRNGLLVALRVGAATGTAEREHALEMLAEHATDGATVAADKGYDQRAFVDGCRELGVTPHVATKAKHSAIDGRTTRHAGYEVSMRIRKRIEEIFGWAKTVGGYRRTRFRGIERTQQAGYFVGAAYNMLRIANLAAAT
ncbi:MAG TPA: IS5 family transposase [Plantibacter sp.]|uniref:IS5 family transposase n=1 Tax=Plantibacter sp. TaxID=1871045 RepID=UPI002CC5662F|nr:IS5 family transposase [Plantibacter sp.]